MDIKGKEIKGFKGKSTKRDGWFEFHDGGLELETGLGLTVRDSLMLTIMSARLAYAKMLCGMGTDNKQTQKELKEKIVEIVDEALKDFDEWGEDFMKEAAMAELFQASETIDKDGDTEIKCVAIGLDEELPEELPQEVKDAINKMKAELDKGGELH